MKDYAATVRSIVTSASTTDLSPLDPTIDLSIVIVSWNTIDLLRACLASLSSGAVPLRYETIVVDNASDDGSAEMVQHEFSRVCLLVNARNQGFAAANNRGLSHAHGRYLLLLNSDTIVPQGAIAEMVGYLETHPSVGALGPRLLNEDGSLQSSARDFPHLGRDALALLDVERWPLIGESAHRYLRRVAAYWSDHQTTREVDWVMGACMLLRREALEQTGLLDAGYFFFAEEMDLCYRLREHGWPTVFFAGAKIVHLGGQSARRIPAARLVWHYTGLLRFYRLHCSPLHSLALRIVIAAAAAAHVMWLLVAHRHSREARPILSAYARVLARVVR